MQLERQNPVVFLASSIDGCCLWRLWQPYLSLPGSSFFCFRKQIDYSRIVGNEICVVQRLCTQQQFEVIRTLASLGLKIIYDIDDDVWDIPPANPAYRILMQYKEGFKNCIRITDVVTVSTRYLARVVQKNVKTMINMATGKPIPIVVAENRVWEQGFVRPERPEKVTVGWAGSSSHIEDVGIVLPALYNLARENDDIEIEMRGCQLPPTAPLLKMPNFHHRPWTPVPEYTSRMPVWRWSIALAPVTDHPFNLSKCFSPETPVVALIDGRLQRTYAKKLLTLFKTAKLFLPGPRGDWRRVTAVELLPRAAGYSIGLRNGSFHHVTEAHRFLRQDGHEVYAKDLRVGDILASAPLQVGLPEKSAGTIGYNAGWLVGLFIGDGSTAPNTGSGARGGNSQVCISCNITDTEALDKLERIALHLGATSVCKCPKKDSLGVTVVLSGHIILGLIRQFVVGSSCYDKHLSMNAWNVSLEFLRGIVDGWLDADGHRTATRSGFEYWTFQITRNWNLIRDLTAACSMVGYRFKYTRRWATGFGKQYKTVQGGVKKHIQIYQSAKPLHEVMSIEPIEVTPLAVEVDGHHLFVLPDGTITHNSCVKMIEAAYCGIPCLASWTAPYEGFCHHDPELQWLLCAGQSSWERKLRDLIHDTARRDELGRRMHKVMVDHYSYRQPHEGWNTAFRLARGGVGQQYEAADLMHPVAAAVKAELEGSL